MATAHDLPTKNVPESFRHLVQKCRFLFLYERLCSVVDITQLGPVDESLQYLIFDGQQEIVRLLEKH